MNRKTLWIVFAIMVILYIWSYYRTPKEVTILQTSLEEFQFDMLREKQPLVIDDRVPNYEDIWRLWFSQNLVTPMQLGGDVSITQPWFRNRYKYLLCHAQTAGEILLCPPGRPMVQGAPHPDTALVAIHLEPNQMAIIPRRYSVHVDATMKVAGLGIHDYVTVVLP